jgi:predicted GNAT family acetyltransferase
MEDIKLTLNDAGQGAFSIEKDGDRLAEMVIAVQNSNLTVFHTEVSDELKGKGVASALLSHMVEYAKENKLKVIPLCPFVLAQFKRHPDQYQDVWNQDWHHSSST